MRLLLACLLAAYFLAPAVLSAEVPVLMPMPVKAESNAGALTIDGKFTVSASGPADPRIEAALTRFIARVARQTGLIVAAKKPVTGAATLHVEIAGHGVSKTVLEYPTLGEDESYALNVTVEGAVIKAPAVDGALRGLETFAQLIAPGPDGFRAPAMQIEDHPRFAWRGLMMDVSRHFMPVEVVERNLDAMAAVKLNVLHWHLSDDQGFRVESKLHPRLQLMGSDGLYYTQAEIRQVVAYARDRGIRVVPEFDIPGHTASWFPGYPELTIGKGPFEILGKFGVSDDVIDPTREYTYAFLDSFIGEMALLFPDKYFHVGGDEVNGKQWNGSTRIQAFAKAHGLKNSSGLQVYFNQRIQKIVQKHGKIMIGWDEVLHPDLPKATVVHIWRNQAALADAVQKGYRTILSWGYYLDHLSPAGYHYGIDPMGGPAEQLTAEQQTKILGGEACMWSELVDAETVDSRIWPRMAAIAERFWSPKEVTDVASMYTRLEAVSRMLDWTGVQHRAGYAPMLSRLAAERPNEPLRILADASEALGLGPRSRVGHYTTDKPLNRFVDAARPESESVRALEQAATRAAADPKANAADVVLLREQFTRWSTNDAQFEPLAEGNALLAEVKPLSVDLSAAGAAGLRLLDGLSGGTPLTSDWLSQENTEVTRMLRPNAEVTLAAVRVVKILLDAAQKQPR
jgi:hexosaminidase